MADCLRLADICTAIVDCVNRTAPDDEFGDFFAVGTSAMRGNSIDFSAARRISAETFERWTRRLVPQAGDLLLAREAPVGPVVQIPSGGRVAPGQRTTMLRANHAVAHPRFLYYYLIWPDTQARLMALSMGSTVPHLRVADVHNFPILHLPSLPTQTAIAEVLGALDDKISANEDSQAQISALSSALMSQMLKSATTTRLIGEIAKVTKGVSYRSSDLAPSETALVTLKSVDKNGYYAPRGIKPYVGVFKPSQVVHPGETVVAQTDLTQAADVVGRAVRVPANAKHERLVASLDLAIVRPVGRISPELLHGLLSNSEFQRHCQARTSGTTVLHLKTGAIEEYETPMPDDEWAAQFSGRASVLFDLLNAIQLENEVLAELRDTLLPQLMSGAIGIKDAHDVVSAVV